MPKVKKEYFEDKKNSILDVAEKICRTKPLYKLTMKDIIIGTGLSPGAIYASFSDIDDVIVSLVNRLSVSVDFTDATNTILQTQNAPEKKIELLFHYLIELIQSTVTSYGKIHLELSTVLTDISRRQKIVDGIDEVQMYGYVLNAIAGLIEEGVTSGYFHPIHPKQNIYTMIFAFVDGLVRDLTFVKCYHFEGVPQSVTFEEKDLSNTFAASVIFLLNHKN